MCTYAIFEVVRTPEFSHKLAEAEHKGRRARAVVARGQEKVPQRLDVTQRLRTRMRAKAVFEVREKRFWSNYCTCFVDQEIK